MLASCLLPAGLGPRSCLLGQVRMPYAWGGVFCRKASEEDAQRKPQETVPTSHLLPDLFLLTLPFYRLMAPFLGC